MLKIRLQRVGRKNDPSFRVVVINSQRAPKTGNYIEMLGSYNPRQKTVTLNAERIQYWISVGAQASATIHNILVDKKIIDGKKVNPLPRKSPIKSEVEKSKVKEVETQVVSEVEPKTEDSEEVKAVI